MNVQLIKIFILILVSLSCVACNGDSRQDSNAGFARILNGDRVEPSEMPQLVEVHFPASFGESFCTGVVIDSSHILTAGHCLVDATGPLRVEAYNGNFAVESAVLHPLYREDLDAGAIFHDLAILSVGFHGLPALPILRLTSAPYGEQFLVAGFGITENESYGELVSGIMSVEMVTDHHLFSLPFQRGSESNPCNGDSGGPAVFHRIINGLQTFGIAALVSTGTLEFCEEGDVTAFTNLLHPDNLQFISESTSELTILDVQ